MRLILGNRGTGKTTKAIEEANLLDSYGVKVAVIIPYKDFEKTLRTKGLKRDIPVYSINEIKDKNLTDYILIFDEVEGILRALILCKAICATADLENSMIIGGN